MSVPEYRDHQIVLIDVLKLWHAPYAKHDDQEETDIQDL